MFARFYHLEKLWSQAWSSSLNSSFFGGPVLGLIEKWDGELFPCVTIILMLWRENLNVPSSEAITTPKLTDSKKSKTLFLKTWIIGYAISTFRFVFKKIRPGGLVTVPQDRFHFPSVSLKIQRLSKKQFISLPSRHIKKMKITCISNFYVTLVGFLQPNIKIVSNIKISFGMLSKWNKSWNSEFEPDTNTC